MAKKKFPSTQKKETYQEKRNALDKKERDIIPKKYQDVIAIVLLFICQFVFLSDVFFKGKKIETVDLESTRSISTSQSIDAMPDGTNYWDRHIFSGMPTSSSNIGSNTNRGAYDHISDKYFSLVLLYMKMTGSDAGRLIMYWMIFAIGIYALLRIKQFSPFQSFIPAVGMLLCTLMLEWLQAWHSTKLGSVAFIPWVILCIEKLRMVKNWKKSLGYFTGLVVSFAFFTGFHHLQIVYYFFLFLGIYVVVVAIQCFLKNETWKVFSKIVSLLALATILIVALQSEVYLGVSEYSKYSIRGSKSVKITYPELATSSAQPESNSATTPKEDAEEGLDYDYATSWSFPVEEVLTFFVPAYFGYGGQSYWGQMTFTSGPSFLGMVLLILAVFGAAIYRKDFFVQLMIAVGLFSLLLSFGKHFSLVYDLFFTYVPYFNKFRVPSMILIITQISVAILAAYGIKGIFEWKDDNKKQYEKYLQYTMFAMIGLTVIVIVGISGCKSDFFSEISNSNFGKTYLEQYGKTYPDVIQRIDAQLGLFIKMKTDVIITFIILSVFLIATYFFVTQKLMPSVYQVILFGLIVVDFGRADSPLLNEFVQDKKNDKKIKESTQIPDYVQYIQKDKSYGRTLPYVSNPTSNWFIAHGIESVDGYHPAKLRLYQDLMDMYGGGNTSKPTFFQNSTILNLLAVKFIALDKPYAIPNFSVVLQGEKSLLQREKPTKRYWFVQEVIKKSVPEILKSFEKESVDVYKTAFVENDLKEKIDPADTSATVTIKQLTSHQIDLRANATGNNFMFISEIYYPAGWKCYIDGKETEMYKTDYAFRGVIVPKGEHDVQIKYENNTLISARNLSKTVNVFLYVLIFVTIALNVYWNKNFFLKNKEGIKSILPNEEKITQDKTI